MPSPLHEALVELFRGRPGFAPELLSAALHMELPKFTEARIDAADLADVQPAAYRADLVVHLLEGSEVLGIVIEVQGGANRFVPLVLRPSGVPEVVDEARAQADPELAILSAMAHGKDADTERSAQIAVVAQRATRSLDEGRSKMYFDLIDFSLSEAARQALQAMDPRKYEYQSDFARRYVAEGEAKGRAALVAKLLASRFGPITREVETRISEASAAELDEIAERLLTAETLDEAISPSAA